MAEEAAVTSVETDASTVLTEGAVAPADTSTVLTEGAAAPADTNSDTDAAAAASGDDAGAGDNAGAGDDTGSEGSQTPPDTYADFAMPEGVQLDETAIAEALPLFKELGLTQEQAQKAVDLQAKLVQAGSQKRSDDFNQLMTDWTDQSKNDSEFGGDKYEENVKIAQSAVSKYGTPELKQLLNEHGVGNHPEMIRFMVKVGRTLSEDVPGSAGGVSAGAKDRVTQMYGKSTN